MGLVRSLAYVGVGAEDLGAWDAFAQSILGLQIGEPPDGCKGDDGRYYRTDSRSYRLAVEHGENGALHYLGFEVASRRDLRLLAADLRSSGWNVQVEDAELCTKRRVAELFSAADPFGNRLEFFVGHHHARTPFLSPTGAQFVTGPLGIGHAFLWISSVEDFLDCYVDTLGFALSDTLEVGPGNSAQFLHCNPRHHSLAGMVSPSMPLGLGHLMIEVDTLDAVGGAYDRCINAQIPIFATLGKHANDQMVSFYAQSPSGFPIEFGVNGRLIDDATWVVSHYTEDRVWGHAGPSERRA